MIDTVLVPMDDSPLSTDALEYALETHDDAEITVLNVLDFVDAGYSAPMESSLPGYWEDWYETATERAEALFTDARELADEYDRELDTDTVVGKPTRGIVDYADEHDIDQIVMGSHGRTGVSRLVLGSVAENVVRRASCPVTVVR